MTLAHEIGHLLDQVIVGYNGYASADSGSPLSKVMDRIRQSRAFQALSAIALSSEMDLPQQIARRRAIYWLGVEELWARAYAQYIATYSQEVVLREEIVRSQSLEAHAASAYVQWQEIDFQPILEAIDTAFAALGWS